VEEPDVLSGANDSELTSRLPMIGSHTIPLAGSLALRVYSDNRPHNLKIAELQKGLILVHNGEELVGEGSGFGVPVLLYSGETYFSGASNVYLSQQKGLSVVRKEFLMNVIPKKKLGKIGFENRMVRTIRNHLDELYRTHRHFRLLSTKKIYRAIGLRTHYVQVDPIGRVTTTYVVGRNHVEVHVDLGQLKGEALQKTFILNEQGSEFFRRYSDSDDAELFDKHIGAWELVEAEWADLADSQGGMGFRLWRKENSVLRRGREFLKDWLDWVGLDYEIDPRSDSFQYDIEILGGS
jgi:hypothetical protein